MTQDVIKFSFVAGEIAPNFQGRSDLEKYDLALEEAENWFVDYRGGISTRPGQEFVDYIKNDTQPLKAVPFKFSSDIEDTYLVLFGHLYVRFIQDGAYVLETGQSITSISKANPGVLTKNSHGYSDGDWVKLYNIGGMTDLEGQTVVVTGSTPNTFQLVLPTGQNINTTDLATFTSGTMARVYTVVSPYDADDLELLQVQQNRGDLLRLTHLDYPIHNLIRVDHDTWTISEEDFDNLVARPSSLTLGSAVSGDWGVAYAITAVDLEGNESYASAMIFDQTAQNPATVNNTLRLRWNYTDPVAYFNIYRTRFFYQTASYISRSAELGYIGRSFGTHFQDNGIIPDFSITPPKEANPFADGAIESIVVTNGGSSYEMTDTVTISDPDGTGFVGYLIIEIASGAINGPIAGVLIVNRGRGYTNPTVVVSAGGAGAALTATTTPLTGNNPNCAALFQQRQLYGATANRPLSIFGSRPGRLSNFDQSQVVTDGDPYEHVIDAESYSPIRHLVAAQGGCLVFTQDGVWLLNSDTGVVTPLNANADPKSFGGSALLPPLKVDADLLYLEGRLDTVRMLSFNDVNQERFYSGKDVSILANHLISEQAALSSWCYSPGPYKQVVATREDGQVLAFTILKEQEIFGWTRYRTKGLYEHVTAIQEGRRDSLYFITKRYINGRWTKFIERQVERKFSNIEEAFCVDCGLALNASFPAATLQLSGASGSGIIATASAGVFSSGDVGKIIRAKNGKAVITGYTNTTNITVSIAADRAFETIYNTTRPMLLESGKWSMDSAITQLVGLYHLEGETLSVLADGNVVDDLVVTAGRVTLPTAASRIVVGLGYKCKLKSLPMTIPGAVVESKRKRIPGIVINFSDSRGCGVSNKSYDRLYELKDRTDETWGEATRAQTGQKFLSLAPKWDRNGQIYVAQNYPLPATIRGWVPQVEIGDDSD